MKKLFYILFLLTNTLLYSQNLYFDKPRSGDVINSGPNGYAEIEYYILDPSWFFYCISYFQTQILVPGVGWTQWEYGQGGSYYVTKAGSYWIRGRAWVCGDAGGGNNYYISSYDINFSVTDNYAPAQPQGLQASKSSSNHPLLNWTACTQTDFSYYKIFKYVTSELGWQYRGFSFTNSFEDVDEIMVTGPLVANEHNVRYKVSAVDINSNESIASEDISVRVQGPWLEKSADDYSEIINYSLNQNYPNPFNPSTNISYSIPEKGLVTLKVYDMLGNEIVELVNEEKEKGNYSIDFVANNLASGVYIYTIRSKNFVESKRMILLK